jgi:phage gp37-like protein
MYAAGDIEDAFLSALEPLREAGTVRTLESYGGQLSEEELKKGTPRFPAVYVIWGGTEIQEVNRLDQLRAQVSVIVCDRSLRGEAAARRGAPEAPGVYAVLEQARGLLHRRAVLAGWSTARLLREGPLAYDREGGLAIYEAVYEVKRMAQGA